MAIMYGTKYDTDKKFKRAVGDMSLANPETVTPIAVAVPPTKKTNMKKIIVWGAIALVAYLLYKKYKKA